MESLEKKGRIPLKDKNMRFIDDFKKFGIEDQEILDQIMRHGTIVDIDVFDNTLEIFYKTKDFKKIVVRKSKLREIDPQTGKIVRERTHFTVDSNPDEQSYNPDTFSKEERRYPEYERKTTPDLTEVIK